MKDTDLLRTNLRVYEDWEERRKDGVAQMQSKVLITLPIYVMPQEFDQLQLRGALVFLSRANSYVTRGHKYNEWGDTRFYEPEIEAADIIFKKAIWAIQDDLNRLQNRKFGA